MATNVNTPDRRTVVGVFDGPNHAETALNQLKAAGFSPEQVSVVARDKGEAKEMVESTGMGGGAATCAVAGGVLGGLGGFLLGISALAIPGIGPIVGSGILLSTLAGAGIGAAAGGLVGALTEHGIPEEDARGYEEHVRKGSILLTVHANSDEQAEEAHRILHTGRGGDVRAYGTGAAAERMARVGRDGAAGGTTTGAGAVITSGELRDEGGQMGRH
jgi:uncharacterized membrane protein